MRKMCFFVSLFLIFIFCGLCRGSQSFAEQEAEFLLDGVKEIGAPGSPGPLCVFGDKAFAVVAGRARRRVSEPVVAACEYGGGRAVAFGHTGYLDVETLDTADTKKLLLNVVKWCARSETESSVKVGVHKLKGLAEYLEGFGVNCRDVGLEELSSVDVLVVNPESIPDEKITRVREFVSGGKGLICGSLGWGWIQTHPGKKLAVDSKANRLFAPMGIVWADGYLRRTSESGYLVDRHS